MPVQPFGKADPYYDALRVMSNQNIQGAALGDTGAGGVLENKIYLWPADGSTIMTFDPDEAGLIAALAAAASGDTVWLPSMTIALTAAITIPTSVIVRGISSAATLSFSGFNCTTAGAVNLSDFSILIDLTVYYNGTGQTNAYAIYIDGKNQASLLLINVYVEHASGDNAGLIVSGHDAEGVAHVRECSFHAHGGTSAWGIKALDYVHCIYSIGRGEGASLENIGVACGGASSTSAPWIEWVRGFTQSAIGTARTGIYIQSGKYGTLKHATANGDGIGLHIDAGATASVFAIQYTSLTNNGSIVLLPGDRSAALASLADLPDYAQGNIIRGGATEWESYDANNAGFIVQGDGTDIKSAAFDWDVFAAGSGADMVHSHADNAEGGVLPGVDIASDSANIAAVNFLEDGKPTAPAANHRIIYAKSTGVYVEDSAGNEVGPLGATPSLALDDLTDVNTAGEAQGDVIYDNAGTWIPYPLGIGSKITVSGTKIRFGNVTGGNYLEIDSVTGTLRLAGDATAFDDFRVEASVVKPGATAPQWKAFGPSGNLQALMFEASHDDEAYFELQMPHAWRVGTNIYPHVHWTPTDATAGNVVWQLEYAWANIGDAYGAPSTMATDPTAAGGVAWVHKLTDFKSGGNNYIDGTGKTLSSMLVCRVHRNSNSGSDTLNKDVALLEIDFHYQIDSFGSDELLVKDASASLLLETGDILLIESGDRLLLE